MNDTNGWIDVRDRWPEPGTTVFLWDANAPETGVSAGCYVTGGWSPGWYEYGDDGTARVNVTHWYPQPAPPVIA